jgi:aminobenzoyl-glutamate utilization protein A
MPEGSLPRDVAAIRRDFHRHPELGFTEFRTASRVAAALAAAGWQVRAGAEAIGAEARMGVPDDAELAPAHRRAVDSGAARPFVDRMAGGLTAVVGDLVGSSPGPTLAIRFDIDALPILESAAAERPAQIEGYRSQIEGVMHACGHDGHAAIGIALARALADRQFPGRVRLLFQPAEEGARGGAALAAAGMVADVDRLVCVHLGLGVPTGALAPSVTGLLANTKLQSRFIGVAAHAAAAPQEGRHALLAAATALLNLHAMPRFADADTRINVGVLAGGTASNIIPAEAMMLLETRADGEAANVEMERRARRILAGAAAASGVEVDITCVGAAATGVCSPGAAEAVRAAAEAVNLTPFQPPNIGVSDDATALMRDVQGAGGEATYCVVGADLAAPHHTPEFDCDEAALARAVELLVTLARSTEMPIKFTVDS